MDDSQENKGNVGESSSDKGAHLPPMAPVHGSLSSLSWIPRVSPAARPKDTNWKHHPRHNWQEEPSPTTPKRTHEQYHPQMPALFSRTPVQQHQLPTPSRLPFQRHQFSPPSRTPVSVQHNLSLPRQVVWSDEAQPYENYYSQTSVKTLGGRDNHNYSKGYNQQNPYGLKHRGYVGDNDANDYITIATTNRELRGSTGQLMPAYGFT
ncbi:hypothetical protein Pmani_022452 [Petrolisthes manimaculis]|uniref:Uncharacterized protein n=1 Tax=Petrolisthes manimaculis TaxID=1843537 RepID=A0AAE1PDX1_9EUCA|nr:hypothetical protein Pmani_022452 [Petrolisthes manimaculis]